MKPADRATYLYCVLRAPKTPSTRGAPTGLPGCGPVRALEVGDALWLMVADAPLSRYATAAIERGLRDLDWVSSCAMAHEAVVEHFARSATVVPLKLFTLFASDERAVAHVRGGRRQLDTVLDRVAGRQEWGVRVTVDEDAARKLAHARVPVRSRAAGSGTTFLAAKKAERDAVRDARANAGREIDAVFDALARHADDARRRPAPSGDVGARMLLDAAFLVSMSRQTTFKSEVDRVARRLAPSAASVTLTGPWPPYNFVAQSL